LVIPDGLCNVVPEVGHVVYVAQCVVEPAISWDILELQRVILFLSDLVAEVKGYPVEEDAGIATVRQSSAGGFVDETGECEVLGQSVCIIKSRTAVLGITSALIVSEAEDNLHRWPPALVEVQWVFHPSLQSAHRLDGSSFLEIRHRLMSKVHQLAIPKVSTLFQD
jgi:hypothetical protein